MVHIGYALSSEEHPANDLVAYARRAEEAGFEYAMISDHYHPWIDEQGESTFVWSVLGGIARETARLTVGTGVTCPTMRYHPAIIAQAAATVAEMMPGRFLLGVGTGEALNEHITGDHFPSHEVRAEMLEEAVDVIRQLWSGDLVRHYGEFFTVENARVYSRPDATPPIIVAAAGRRAADLAGRIGDGLINFTPDHEVVAEFRAAGGGDKPRFVQFNVCWAADETEARRTARETVPTVALQGEVTTLLPTPKHFEQATAAVTEDQIAEVVVCGPDPGRHLDGIRTCVEAGFDHVHVDQVGPDQEGFFRFYEREILPELR
ncbi:TIGR03557 family F420-dependent LLM class oxidoreductase [Planosporangium mesophilum]|uniref:LLM class F420-dependent oxidoreductase n=1 Tax=Planosporangium mesophilum TaxID=689768 RepID=A0A8J3TD10_9ACTN|nr:TIGR03557 family F420-dependent LLM class oxidoreductase [Planosporangium mesophilum]NJC84080.1 TIGR03557 family F420-dependent LLM class oxidoreductase [Planosporangium mesophilum]GII22917.1 LLM class F420-dependent oxidoreductase [Planosporangium mesophilum]